MPTLLQDLRFAFRKLARTPGFTLAAVLTLALGIGATTSIFSLVNAVLLKPLEYREPDRLVFLHSQFTALGPGQFGLSPGEFQGVEELTRTYATLGAWRVGAASVLGDDEPVRVTSAIASAGFFTALGVPAQLGRTFLPEEDVPGAAPVVVFSDRMWRSTFGADRSIIGRTVEVDGVARTVIGIMPPGFDIGDAGVDVWVPLALPPGSTDLGSHILSVLGRLAPGATLDAARAEMRSVLARWGEARPGFHMPNDSTHRILIRPLADELVGEARSKLLILLGAVGLVLLIACANVANLLLARAESRQKEVAVRVALGAARHRLVRQFLTESVVLAVLGGAVGLLLGDVTVRALLAMNPGSVPRADTVGLDGTVILFTLGVSVVTGLLFGLAPLLHLAPRAMTMALREGGRRTTADANRRRLRSALVVGEIALAVMLVVGSGLLLRSFAALQEVDPGFDSESLLTFQISLPPSQYPEPVDRIAFYQTVIERIEAVPGVQGATAMTGLPPVRDPHKTDTEFEGRAPTPDGPPHNVDFYNTVTTGYFEAMGIPIVHGRSFGLGDDVAAAPAAVINETFARVFYPDEDPIGRRVKPYGFPEWLTIVGVAKDVKQGGLSEATGTELYMHAPQLPALGGAPTLMYFAVRTTGDPMARVGAVRDVVRALDPSLPLAHIQSMEANLAGSVDGPRFVTLLLTLFAAVALALAAVGTYGILAYSVAERRHEIGIRMALGGEAGNVIGMVLGEGARVAAVGLVAGLAGALALTRLLASLLFEVSSTDPVTFILAPGVLAVVSLAACWIPARRAAKVDPMVALRAE